MRQAVPCYPAGDITDNWARPLSSGRPLTESPAGGLSWLYFSLTILSSIGKLIKSYLQWLSLSSSLDKGQQNMKKIWWQFLSVTLPLRLPCMTRGNIMRNFQSFNQLVILPSQRRIIQTCCLWVRWLLKIYLRPCKFKLVRTRNIWMFNLKRFSWNKSLSSSPFIKTK